MKTEMDWLAYARELTAIAQTGLHYSEDIFDQERYGRILTMAQEMMAVLMDTCPTYIRDLQAEDAGHQTPKIDTRAVVWRDDQLLLVQEANGLWSLPGGWMDVTETLRSNAKKEAFEEAGARVEPGRVIALLDRNINNPGKNPYTIVKVFVECDYIEGDFIPNSETLACDFFSLDSLPPLEERKTSYDQVDMCFQAKSQGQAWQVKLD
ncbi:TPA: NUDIX hydrolase N-terminal domain-containing protein [Streptococcus suis]